MPISVEFIVILKKGKIFKGSIHPFACPDVKWYLDEHNIVIAFFLSHD